MTAHPHGSSRDKSGDILQGGFDAHAKSVVLHGPRRYHEILAYRLGADEKIDPCRPDVLEHRHRLNVKRSCFVSASRRVLVSTSTLVARCSHPTQASGFFDRIACE
ncbi:MAG: hypothetical protein NTW21_08475 [Verrucomicrobia bacterium]|nr:hypothetical protein [Verrucomicrobiota bacterium]